MINENEMAQFAFMPEMFDNLNTPEDLERARLAPHRQKTMSQNQEPEHQRLTSSFSTSSRPLAIIRC